MMGVMSHFILNHLSGLCRLNIFIILYFFLLIQLIHVHRGLIAAVTVWLHQPFQPIYNHQLTQHAKKPIITINDKL